MIVRDAHVNIQFRFGDLGANPYIVSAQNVIAGTNPVRSAAVAAPETTGSAYIDIPESTGTTEQDPETDPNGGK